MTEQQQWKCPWCGHEGPPLRTDEHTAEAIWEWGHGTPADIARNPCMCSECYHVGGREDWVL
jgi:hypothetical protein